MRHHKKGKKFGRMKGQRKAFLKSLSVNLLTHGKITTTETRAKEIRGTVERMVTHAKKQNVASLRLLMKSLPKKTAYKLYHEIAPRYKERNGGYTRVTKLGKRRVGDGARAAIIELV